MGLPFTITLSDGAAHAYLEEQRLKKKARNQRKRARRNGRSMAPQFQPRAVRPAKGSHDGSDCPGPSCEGPASTEPVAGLTESRVERFVAGGDIGGSTTPALTAQTAAPRSRELAQLESSMTREEAILRIADELDPVGAIKRTRTIECAEALLEDWMLHAAFVVDGTAPFAEIVEAITEEEKEIWKRNM